MNNQWKRRIGGILPLAAGFLIGWAGGAEAAIQGITGTAFDLTAKSGYISTPDGGSIYMWGLANGAGRMQYPAPTLILDEDVAVTVNLTNQLKVPVSLVFPGQGTVTATGGTPGLVTTEALPGAAVSYTFTPAEPGTYTYYSGTQSDLQVEMGLVGAIVVRPAGYDGGNTATWRAYAHDDSLYDHEYLFLMTDLDPKIHQAVERGNRSGVDTASHWAVYWFLNGRAAPDTMSAANVAWLPNQPYNCMPQTHPGERVLLRMVGGGRDGHPLHTHGNHHEVIARNGRLLGTVGAENAEGAFTSAVFPGQTVDALYSWTGAGLGWDMYGHANPTDPLRVGADCVTDGVALAAGESLADHCRPIPVVLPDQQSLTFGPWYSGSPFLGSSVPLPPGEGGLNPNAGFMFMFHSHNEKEITNNDIFPGGMLTMMDVEPPGVPLMNP